MKDKLIELAKSHLGPLLYVAFFVLLALVGNLALKEHDARLLASQAVKTADTQVAKIDTKAKAAKRALQVKAKTVKTPEAAVEAIPELGFIPMHPEVIPGTEQAKVDAEPLYQNLNQCAQDRVDLNACTEKLATRDGEIKQLKQPRSFWKRTGTALKWAAIVGGAGYVIGRSQR